MLSPLYTDIPTLTQAEETTLATQLTTAVAPANSKIIYNSTLLKVRVWNGTAFANAPSMPNGWGESSAPNHSYRTLMTASGSHIAGSVVGTYAIVNGTALIRSGVGSQNTLQLININSADYPAINGVTTKLRIRATVSVNAVAPTGNFTIGLYPVTSSGGVAGQKIYTLGTLVTGSATTSVVAPAVNSMTSVVGTDFVLPANGVYALGIVTTTTTAVSSLVHINATLQLRN